jgi:putative ABC transport system permease protein
VNATDRAYAEYRLATRGFFDTMSIPFLEGRNFTLADPRHVAIVSRALAEHAFGNEDVVGREIRANPWGAELESFEIVGVVSDVRFEDLRKPP